MYKLQLNENEINKIKSVLNRPDGIIAFPTDTVWGVGCLVENKKAVDKIYSAKGRTRSKPLILLGSKIEHLMPFVDQVHDNAFKIINKYLPGAVTIVLPKSSLTPDYVTSSMGTVGIRIPDCPPFWELLDKCVDNHVLATTSANISNMGANSTKSEVENTMGKEVDYILDDYGFVPRGTESTVVSVNNSGEIKILRQGAIVINLED